MGRSDAAVEVRTDLRRGLAARLAGDGWHEVEHHLYHSAFIRPVGDGFAATAEVVTAGVVPDDVPVEVVDVRVGVLFEPLRRWWPLLGDRFALSLLDVRAWDRRDGDPLLELSGRADVPAAVEVLASAIAEHGVRYAERYANHDALLAAIDDGLTVPALLAAAGRFDEAAAALDRYEPRDRAGFTARADRRTAYHLRRWVNSRGDEALLPDGPPPSGLENGFQRRSFATIRAEDVARREAVEAVRREGPDRSRDELRAALEHEFARRGLVKSPLDVERTLDHLWDTRADRVRMGVEGLKALGRFGVAVTKAIRARELPDWSTPQWLEPPDPAFYALPSDDRWTQVSLDRDVDETLARIHGAVRPRPLGMASVAAWLRPEDEAIAVYIGPERVGVIAPDAAATYRPALQAAAFREELPTLGARLTHRDQPPTFLLELAVPR